MRGVGEPNFFQIIGVVILFIASGAIWGYAMRFEFILSWIPVILGIPTFFFLLWLYNSLKYGTFNDDVHFFFTKQRRDKRHKCQNCRYEFYD